MWNDSAHWSRAASAATIREREAENGDAAAGVVQATAGSACGVREPLRPRSLKGEPVTAVGAEPYRGACLRPGSLLQHTSQLAEFASRNSQIAFARRILLAFASHAPQAQRNMKRE